MNNARGYSITSLVVGLAVATSAILISLQTLRVSTKMNNVTSNKIKMNVELASAHKFIVRMGRVAQSCIRGSDSKMVWLECDVAYGRDPLTPITKLRLRHEPSTASLVHEERAVGLLGTAVWQQKLKYKGISGFKLCDSAVILAKACNIANPNLLQLADTSNFKYFRFALVAKSGGQSTGAFTIRNGGPRNLSYAWSD